MLRPSRPHTTKTATMRLLIVEDEPKTSAYLAKGLGEHGFVVDIAGRGDDGLNLAQTLEFDLVILDVMLPKITGWSVLAALQQSGKPTPDPFRTGQAERRV